MSFRDMKPSGHALGNGTESVTLAVPVHQGRYEGSDMGDDLTQLAGEWLNQLDSHTQWMNEMTARTIAGGVTGDGSQVLMLGALADAPAMDGLAQAATGGEAAMRVRRVMGDPHAKPDVERLRRADDILARVCLTKDVDRAGVYGLRGVFALWRGDMGLAGDYARESLSCGGSPESHEAAALVRFAVANGLKPAYLTAPVEPRVPDEPRPLLEATGKKEKED